MKLYNIRMLFGVLVMIGGTVEEALSLAVLDHIGFIEGMILFTQGLVVVTTAMILNKLTK